jgi:hypothetical protein
MSYIKTTTINNIYGENVIETKTIFLTGYNEEIYIQFLSSFEYIRKKKNAIESSISKLEYQIEQEYNLDQDWSEDENACYYEEIAWRAKGKKYDKCSQCTEWVKYLAQIYKNRRIEKRKLQKSLKCIEKLFEQTLKKFRSFCEKYVV